MKTCKILDKIKQIFNFNTKQNNTNELNSSKDLEDKVISRSFSHTRKDI